MVTASPSGPRARPLGMPLVSRSRRVSRSTFLLVSTERRSGQELGLVLEDGSRDGGDTSGRKG